MAIVELQKVTLYGAAGQKSQVIERLQQLGCVHLVNLTGSGRETGSRDVAAHSGLRYLRSCPEQRRQVRRTEEFDLEHVVAETRQLQRKQQELNDERDELKKAILDVEPWGDFSIPDDRHLGGVHFWFYAVATREADKLAVASQSSDEQQLAWREINRDQQNAYIVVLDRQQPASMPGRLVKLDPRPLSELRVRLEEVEEQLEDVLHRRIGLTRWTDLLSAALDQADDAAARERAAERTVDQSGVFALQGWAPGSAVADLRHFTQEQQLAIEVEPPSHDDQPPTLLDNPERVAGGEGLVTFYKSPVYRAWDPSLVAYLSFAVFFAMILADAGYAAVIGLLTARYWKKMGQTRGGRRGRNVLATLVVFAIVYGVICGSYFGFSPSPDSPLGQLVLLDASSQQVMMPLTIVIGVIHLSLANLVMAWLNAGRAVALSSLGWVAVMAGATAGGIGVFANVEATTAGQLTRIGAGLLIGGLVAIFLFSSDRPLFSLSPKNHLLRVFDGFKGLAGASGLFGDVLSYLRLFALGLSSAKLAETFNGLAQGAWDKAGFGVILAIGILLLGHTLNLLLGIMSGVVHGLRLNCIEFFKWSLPEEGYLFSAFAKKGKET